MRNLTIRWALSASVALSALASSPGCGGDASPGNTVPSATGVSITDDDGGHALEGDDLTGSYTYADTDGDSEGATTFRWLRDGAAIPGATGTSYTLDADDVPARITFEVTPIALEGETTGEAALSAALSTGTPPVLSGAATFRDSNENAEIDAGDKLVLTFDQAVTVGVGRARPSDFVLPVPGDVLATQSITAGPATNQITLELKDIAQFKARQIFAAGGTPASNDASGIDIGATPAADFIEGASGLDAVASTPVDIVATYVASATPFGSTGSRALAVGDLDGDGDLDAIAMSALGDELEIRLQASNGSFGSFDTTASDNMTSLALGDLDGDGLLDVVVGRTTGNFAFLNEGAGSLSVGDWDLGDQLTYAVALGDVDRDGDLDMVTANFGANRVWRNDEGWRPVAGAPVGFSPTGQALGTAWSTSVVLGDVNRDGHLDAVFGNETGNAVWFGSANGVFTNSGQSLGSTFSAGIALADVDHDGDLDLIVANRSLVTGNLVWLNDGAGVLSNSGPQYGTNLSVAVSVVDYDSDGDLDLIFANDADAGTRIYENGGFGFFAASSRVIPTTGATALTTGDVDGDGDVDLLLGLPSATDAIYAASLSGAWGSATFVDSGPRFGTDACNAIALGDVNRDGDLDFVVTGSAGHRVWLGDPLGGFADSGQTLGSGHGFSVALGDVDRDGDLDMVVGKSLATDEVWWNDGDGAFSNSGQGLGGVHSSDEVVLGDLDRDGDLDLALATSISDTSRGNRVWLNNGAGAFSTSGQSLGNAQSNGLTLGDIDRDGDLDMAVANHDGNTLWRNNGAALFTDTGESLGVSLSVDVQMGDFQGDGRLDMVVANLNDDANYVYESSDDTGDMTASWALGNSSSRAVAIGDVDGDGVLDIVDANDEQPNQVWIGSGRGTFFSNGQTLGSSASWDIDLADVDRDGDLDIVVGTDATGHEVWFNE